MYLDLALQKLITQLKMEAKGGRDVPGAKQLNAARDELHHGAKAVSKDSLEDSLDYDRDTAEALGPPPPLPSFTPPLLHNSSTSLQFTHIVAFYAENLYEKHNGDIRAIFEVCLGVGILTGMTREKYTCLRSCVIFSIP